MYKIESNQNDKVTIVIVMYKESFDLIYQTLNKIKNFKKIIIDNAGNEHLKKRITSNFFINKYILNKKNIGFSAGYNQGIYLSNTDFTLVLNPDCIISEKDILILLGKFEIYNQCLVLSPTAYDLTNKPTYVGGPLPENGDKNVVLKVHGDTCVESVLGACMIFPTKEFKSNNLFFDENLFLYFSDDDLCRNIKKINKTVVQIFDAKCIHQHGNIKVSNKLERIFIREYHFTFDKLYYFFKVNKHHYFINYYNHKFFSLVFRLCIKILTMQIYESTKIFSRLLAYSKFFIKFIWRGGRVV